MCTAEKIRCSCIDNDKYLLFLLSRQVKCYLFTEALLGFPLYTVCALSSCHSPLLAAYMFVFPTKLCVCVCVCVCIHFLRTGTRVANLSSYFLTQCFAHKKFLMNICQIELALCLSLFKVRQTCIGFLFLF